MPIDWSKDIETDSDNPLPCKVVYEYRDGCKLVIVGVGTGAEMAVNFDDDGVALYGAIPNLRNVKKKAPVLSGFMMLYKSGQDYLAGSTLRDAFGKFMKHPANVAIIDLSKIPPSAIIIPD